MSENKILKDLANGRHPEIALPQFADVLTSGYMKLSFCKLAVNLSSYYDDLEQAGGLDGDYVRENFKRLLTVISDNFYAANHTEPTSGCQKLHEMRTELLKKMRSLYDYVHILGIYEHVMNRIQYRYEENSRPFQLESLMAEIHNYICSDQEPSGMNDRIQDIYGEMPIRMTKSRFLDMVEVGCSYYAGTRNDIADHFFQEMYDQATLPRAAEMNADYSDLHAIVSDMEQLDFDQMTETSMKEALDKLQIAGQQLAQAFSYDFQLLELINDLYILLLNKPYAAEDKEVAPIALNCMNAYMQAARDRNFIGMDEDILEDIRQLNDSQEKLVGMHMLFEDQLAEFSSRYREVIANNGMAECFKSLRLSNILSGIDLMAGLDADKEIFVTDRVYIRVKTDKLLSMYKTAFASCPMIIRRAVIADALTKLPVVSNSVEESEQLIRQNFENCRDQAELHASASLMRTIMNDQKW